MAKEERAAWLLLVQMERAEEERRAKIEAEKKQKQREKLANEKALREAAFDGETAELKRVCVCVRTICVSDTCSCWIPGWMSKARTPMARPHCWRALEEARCVSLAAVALWQRAQADAVRLLLEHGANPNARGKFNRTPLFRGLLTKFMDPTPNHRSCVLGTHGRGGRAAVCGIRPEAVRCRRRDCG